MAEWDKEYPVPEENSFTPDEFAQPRAETEFRLPDSGAEDAAPPGTDYENPDPAQEFTPPGSGGTAAPGRRTKKKRRLRKLVYAAAGVVLTGLLFSNTGGELIPASVIATPAPAEPVYSSSSDVPMPVFSSNSDIPLDVSGGIVNEPFLNIVYAALPAEDQNTVHYSYFASPCMTDPSVEAYISVSDSFGGIVYSPSNPEIIEHSHDREDYTINVSSLQGENLVLTIAIRYDDADGVEREVSQSCPVSRLSPVPELGAFLDVYAAGGARHVEYSAKFLPREGDRHHYELTVESFLLNTYDASGNMAGGYFFGDEENPLEDRMPVMSGSDSEGYVFSYVGFFPGEHIRDEAETYNAILVLQDQSTGYFYSVETEKCLLADLPEISVGMSEQIELSSTEFDCKLVFFSFSAYHHGFVMLANQDKVTAGTVEIWEKNLESLEWSHELTAEEIAAGYYEIPEFDDSDTYFNHMDYFRDGGMPEMELRVTLTLETEEGTETLSYSTAASHEQGWSVHYWPADYEPIWDGQEYYPDSYAVMSYESLNKPVYMEAGGYQDALNSGKICVELTVNGVPVPTNGLMIVTTEEPVYTIDGSGNYVPTDETYYYASIVFKRPEDAPLSGTAEFTVYQKLEGYDLVWTTHKVIDY